MKRYVMLFIFVVFCFLGNVLPGEAGEQGEVSKKAYYGTVTKFSDLTTDSLYKSTMSSGTNKVYSLPGGVSLCSWINNYIGNKATRTATYSSTGTYSMPYTVNISLDPSGAHLATQMVVSTQLFEFDSVYTSGGWSPDSF